MPVKDTGVHGHGFMIKDEIQLNKYISSYWRTLHCRTFEFPTGSNDNMADARICEKEVALAPPILGKWDIVFVEINE